MMPSTKSGIAQMIRLLVALRAAYSPTSDIIVPKINMTVIARAIQNFSRAPKGMVMRSRPSVSSSSSRALSLIRFHHFAGDQPRLGGGGIGANEKHFLNGARAGEQAF